MSSRKRSFRAVDGDSNDSEPSLLSRIRNMWQFANLCQWIYTFGKAAKMDESIDVEDIETECLKPSSEILDDIALALLKLVSSHRGLTHDIFDEQTRKQYLTKAADQNPFGDADVPAKFTDFDIFTKIRVLQQLTQWAMIHPERIRDKMEEQKDVEQTTWRIEPYGWDAEDRTYYVLDDNRVYRMTEPPPPPPPKSKRVKNWRSGRRSSKRRRTTLPVEDAESDTDRDVGDPVEPEDDGLGGMKWECVGVTLGDVQSLVEGFRKSRDENERILRGQLEDHLVPILEKQEQSRKRKELQRERELTNLAKMANAKRSSRIAHKVEQQKQDERAKEEDQHKREAEAAHRREEAARLRIEKERDRRLASREKRFREREARRLQHEEELAQLSEDSKHMISGDGNGRVSERRLNVEIERNKQALKDLEEEEEDWVFDCVCGLYGQVDDGTHSVACERCNIWQHSKCLNISEADAERPEFHFVCASCIRHEQEAKARPRPTIKLKVNHQASPGTHLSAPTTILNGGPVQPADSYSRDTISTSKETGQISPRSQTEPGSTLATARPQNLPVANGVSHPQATVDAHANRSGTNFEGSIDRSPGPESPTKNTFREFGQSPSRGNGIGSSPMAVATPTSGIHGLQTDRAIESVLSTPSISRDKYRAAHLPNGTLPAQAGLSPTKHSPPRVTDPGSAMKINTTTPILPPVTNLSPSPQRLILTPPSKSSPAKSPEPIVPLERR